MSTFEVFQPRIRLCFRFCLWMAKFFLLVISYLVIKKFSTELFFISRIIVENLFTFFSTSPCLCWVKVGDFCAVKREMIGPPGSRRIGVFSVLIVVCDFRTPTSTTSTTNSSFIVQLLLIFFHEINLWLLTYLFDFDCKIYNFSEVLSVVFLSDSEFCFDLNKTNKSK